MTDIKKLLLIMFLGITVLSLTGCEGGDGDRPPYASIEDALADGITEDEIINYFAQGGSSNTGSGGIFVASSKGTNPDIDGNIDEEEPYSNPEPASIALMGLGLFGLLGARLKKKGGNV